MEKYLMAKEESPIKLVTRTRNTWKKCGGSRTIGDTATALGYIIWQFALNGAKKLHIEDFRYDEDRQRLRVIEEYLMFLVHVTDRLVYDDMPESRRQEFVSGVAAATSRHLKRNGDDIGVSLENHTARLNERCAEYAECSFSNEPGYPMLRALGTHIQDIMGSDQTNKWVMDQVMTVDAPDFCKQLQRSLKNLLNSA